MKPRQFRGEPMAERKREFDLEQYRRSVNRLTEIYRGISDTVNTVSAYRCPYKDAQNRCTAQFGCRNQDREFPAGELYRCAGDDNLDYRSAWEV